MYDYVLDPVQSVKDFGEYVYSDDQPPKLRKMMQFGMVHFLLCNI